MTARKSGALRGRPRLEPAARKAHVRASLSPNAASWLARVITTQAESDERSEVMLAIVDGLVSR